MDMYKAYVYHSFEEWRHLKRAASQDTAQKKEGDIKGTNGSFFRPVTEDNSDISPPLKNSKND
jgi:hypothetical protein